jgi:hypothetical protein
MTKGKIDDDANSILPSIPNVTFELARKEERGTETPPPKLINNALIVFLVTSFLFNESAKAILQLLAPFLR